MAGMFTGSSTGMFSGFQLPTGTAPTSFKPQDVVASYNANHAASRNANQELFQRTAAGFDQVLAKQEGDLANSFKFLSGTNRSNIRAIDRRFTRGWGEQVNNLIDRGLGNATIQGAMQQGNQRAHADAISESRSKFGTAMYDASAKNALANSGLAQQQLQFLMANTNIGYPDMGAYSQMAMMGANAGMQAMGAGGFPTQNGQHYAGMQGRPIGGAQPAWAHYGGGGSDPGMPNSGVGMYSGWAGAATQGQPQGPNSGAISGWGWNENGSMTPSYATSTQYGASGYGSGRAEADYSGAAAQGSVDYSSDPMW